MHRNFSLGTNLNWNDKIQIWLNINLLISSQAARKYVFPALVFKLFLTDIKKGEATLIFDMQQVYNLSKMATFVA